MLNRKDTDQGSHNQERSESDIGERSRFRGCPALFPLTMVDVCALEPFKKDEGSTRVTHCLHWATSFVGGAAAARDETGRLQYRLLQLLQQALLRQGLDAVIGTC